MRAPDEIYTEGSLIILDGPLYEVTIDGRRIFYREGAWYEKGEDGEYYPEWSLTCFYEDPAHPENYLYCKQDPPEEALYNLRRILKTHKNG